MFTGIIQELGTVKEFRRVGSVYKVSLNSLRLSKGADIGDSIAVNGVCLTVVGVLRDEVVFEVMDESLKKSNLGKIRRGECVNLEPALKLGDKISGHLISGHIDGTGIIKRVDRAKDTGTVRIEVPQEFIKYIIPKGSVAIDGVSLTVGEVGPNWLSVHIIPHTLKSTTLNSARPGRSVNIELDLMAKYAMQLKPKKSAVTEDFLREKGFA